MITITKTPVVSSIAIGFVFSISADLPTRRGRREVVKVAIVLPPLHLPAVLPPVLLSPT
jgi:hypothetical protein